MKVTVVGAGNVGATCADVLAYREVCYEIVMVDIKEGLSEGKSLDIFQKAPINLYDSKTTGSTNDYTLTSNSDVVVITSGLPRKPGMSRDDLIGTNAKIVTSVTENIIKYSPNCIIIIVSNPLDVMTYQAHLTSKFPRERIMGMAGILDTARFRAFISEELNVSTKDIQALLLGGHGDTMVPLPRFTKVSGKPLLDLVKNGKISKERLESINQRTRDGGAEIVKFLEKGSAFYAPAASGVEMAKAFLKNEKKMLPCAAYLNGEYGLKNIYAGVPIIIGLSLIHI